MPKKKERLVPVKTLGIIDVQGFDFPYPAFLEMKAVEKKVSHAVTQTNGKMSSFFLKGWSFQLPI